MKIRLADEKDADVLARLNRKFNKTQDTKEQIAARIKAEPLAENALVAEVEGKDCRFCLFARYPFALLRLCFG